MTTNQTCRELLAHLKALWRYRDTGRFTTEAEEAELLSTLSLVQTQLTRELLRLNPDIDGDANGMDLG